MIDFISWKEIRNFEPNNVMTFQAIDNLFTYIPPE